MIRVLLILFWIYVIYTILKAVYRAVAGPSIPRESPKQDRLQGEEMVQDPQCRTYVAKSRAVTRRINGTLCLFCSDSCARQYEEQHRA